MKKICILIAVMLILPLTVLSIHARDTTADPMVEDNIVESPFTKSERWYLLETPEDFVALGKLIAEQATFFDGERAQHANYKMTKDMDFTDVCKDGAWIPIGKWTWGGVTDNEYQAAFSGTLNGDNKTITGLNISYFYEAEEAGLLGYGYNGIIENLIIKDCQVIGSYTAGAVIGHMEDSRYGENSLSLINNCHVSGSVTGSAGVGGVVGSASIVTNSSFKGTVTGLVSKDFEGSFSSNIGGIAGVASDIQHCYSDAVVKGFQNVGGVVGSSYRVYYCYSLGDTFGYTRVGGVVGDSAQTVGAFTAGNVSAIESGGGVVGSSATTFNIEADTINGRNWNLLMLGEYIAKVDTSPEGMYLFGQYVGRVVGSVGSDIGTNKIYSRENLKTNFALTNHEYYDGYNMPEGRLSVPEDLMTVLLPEGESWGEHWKPLKAGYLPQLLWETGEPTLLPKYS